MQDQGEPRPPSPTADGPFPSPPTPHPSAAPGHPAAPPPPPAAYPPPPPPSARAQGTNGFAVASLVLGIVGGVLLSVIFGIVALRQIRTNNQGGRGLAIAGLALSAAWVLLIGGFATWATLSEATRGTDGTITGSGSVSTDSLEVGDCLSDLEESAAIASLPAVPCSEPHDGEVFAVFDLPTGAYPGVDEVDGLATDGCMERVPDELAKSEADLFYLHPTRQTWRSGDHEVVCVAVFGSTAT